VQVNNPLDTLVFSFYLGTLSKSSIERLEVIKCTQSSIYGSDAIAGVINFITYDQENSDNISSVSAAVYSSGTQTLSGKLKFEKGVINLTAINSDLSFSGDEQTSLELTGHKVANFFNNSETQFSLRLSDHQQKALPDQSGGILYAQDNIKDDKEGQLTSASVRHNQIISDNYQLALQAEWFQSSETLDSPGITPFFAAPPTYSDNEYDYHKFRLLNGFEFENVVVTAGIDYKSESGKNNGTMDFYTFGETGELVVFPLETEYSIKRETLAGFVDAKWQLDKFTLFTGLRLDNTKDYGEQETWKLGASYQVQQNIRLFANTGTAFKLPSLYALSNSLIGNPNLKPEKASNQDIGIEFNLDKISVSLSLFNYEYQDLVDFDFATFSLVNRSEISSSGAEIIVQANLSDALLINADLTYVELESSENEVLTGRPEWQGGLGVQYQVNETLITSTNLNYVGETLGSSQYTGESAIYDLDAYSKIDVTAQWQIKSDLKLDIYVQNVFDENYQVAVGVPGSELAVGANIHWTLQ